MSNVASSIRVSCNDRDVEDVSCDKLDTTSDEVSIGIGGIGFKFIKTLGRNYLSGVVVRILENEKELYKFNYGEHQHNSFPQLEIFSKNRDTTEV